MDTPLSSHSTLVYYAPLWKRFAAMIYDTLLVVAVSMAYAGISLAINKRLLNGAEDYVSGLLFQLGWLATIMLFFCFFWSRAGQTLGMRAWRLKIINCQQQSPSWLQCIARCILAPIGWLLFFLALFRADRQCLHDRLTHTQTIILPKYK